ncbi:MAG: helix-turn-helix transcriptional regulator [Bacteroidales bacterium]|nr:helix-turn-helix transcriptional regulator [Bacteroidales bacterium]
MERARVKKTQKEVANETGLTASAICNYEKGERVPTLQTLAQLADFYGASIDYLVGK